MYFKFAKYIKGNIWVILAIAKVSRKIAAAESAQSCSVQLSALTGSTDSSSLIVLSDTNILEGSLYLMTVRPQDKSKIFVLQHLF